MGTKETKLGGRFDFHTFFQLTKIFVKFIFFEKKFSGKRKNIFLFFCFVWPISKKKCTDWTIEEVQII